MKHNQIKVQKVKTDESFTQYVFIYKGYEDIIITLILDLEIGQKITKVLPVSTV